VTANDAALQTLPVETPHHTSRTTSVPSPGARPGRRVQPLRERLIPIAPLLAIFAAYALSLVALPPTLPVPLIDDWNYLLSVRHLVQHGELWVAPWTATTLVLQIGWGALFAWPFGITPEALRSSSLVASFGGTLACFALFRELGVSRPRALIGALAVWFNPLVFALSYTFMTDVPFLALLSLASFAVIRAERRRSLGWLAVGSVVAGLGFLVRQQGALIPLATVTWLLIARPAWLRGRRWRALLATLGPCLACVALYALWASRGGLPPTQEDYLRSLRVAGVWGTLDLVWRLATVGAFYVGLFVLPVVLGAAAAVPGSWRRAPGWARHVVVIGLIGAIVWTRWYAGTHAGLTFPFVPWGSILGHDGLGVLDADGERPLVFAPWLYATIAVVVAVSCAAAFVLIVGRRQLATAPSSPETPIQGFVQSPGGLLLLLAAGQFGGIVLPSLHIRPAITFDRYYLPLLPFALGLVLWSLRGHRFAFPPAAVALSLFAIVAIVGCQDWFAFKQAQWQTAAWLVETEGIPLREVDGAAQWDGLHWYEELLAHPADRLAHRPDDPWWLHLIAPQIDPRYIVAASPETRRGYAVWARRPYDSWLRSGHGAWIYVWRRVPAPVVPANPARPATAVQPPLTVPARQDMARG
jgi:4-amino-4-deoxy-L-arabinose transferase-like glycosyltransferase